MPNQRREGQMFIGFQADVAFVRQLDLGRGRKDRSLFIREAIAQKLRDMNIKVPDSLIYPPDRAKVVQISDHKLAVAAEDAPPYRAKRTKKQSQG